VEEGLVLTDWGYSRTTGPNRTGPESTAGAIGLIYLQVKLAGEPGTGKPYAGFDVALVGNVTRGAGLRPWAKALDEPPDPTAGAPVLDPTWKGESRMAELLGLLVPYCFSIHTPSG